MIKVFTSLCLLPAGILFWSFLRLLNNKLYPSYKRKQIEFNLPFHMRRRPMILQYVQICIDFHILFLNAPLRRFPRAGSERLFIGMVCLLSLNIVSLFQSSLATVFIKPMFYKNIDSLQQFADTQQRILIKYPTMMADLFPEDSSETYRTLHDRMILISRPELSSSDVMSMGLATVTRRINSKLSTEGNSVHLIPDCPRSYNLAYVLSTHSVYLDAVNSIILDINQFGFIQKWIGDTYYTARLQREKLEPIFSGRARVLLLDDLQLPFAILAFGIGISLIVLLIENFLKRKIQH